jgi:hypothetical protein
MHAAGRMRLYAETDVVCDYIIMKISRLADAADKVLGAASSPQ